MGLNYNNYILTLNEKMHFSLILWFHRTLRLVCIGGSKLKKYGGGLKMYTQERERERGWSPWRTDHVRKNLRSILWPASAAACWSLLPRVHGISTWLASYVCSTDSIAADFQQGPKPLWWAWKMELYKSAMPSAHACKSKLCRIFLAALASDCFLAKTQWYCVMMIV